MAMDITDSGRPLHRATLGCYERGNLEPNIDMLKVLADYYSVTIEELAFEKLKQ